MEIVIQVAQFLLSLSFLVGVHELGHLVAAKFFGMRVEKFSIGFPPKIFGMNFGETEYSIGAIPLGGFVKISGMIDESMDTEQMSSEPEPWEFRSKPAWQRLIVMLGGIVVNVVIGILIFVSVTYFWGDAYFPTKEVNKNGIYISEVGVELGLQKGDKILKVNGKEFERFNEVISPSFLLADNAYYTVLRDGKEVEIKIPVDFMDKMAGKDRSFVEPLHHFDVREVTSGSAAEEAGVQAGDQIVAVNGRSTVFFQDLQEVLRENPEKKVAMTLVRAGDTIKTEANVNKESKIGVVINYLTKDAHAEYSLMESVPRGTSQAFNVIAVNIKAFGKIFQGDVNPRNALSGPIGIAGLFGGSWNRFWTLTGMLSMVLAFMNLLPIPALDGGHVMFLTYEIISGRPPSDKFLENAQKVGMVLILALMVFAFGNDILKLLPDF